MIGIPFYPGWKFYIFLLYDCDYVVTNQNVIFIHRIIIIIIIINRC